MKSLHRLSLLLLAFAAGLRPAAGSVERTQDTLNVDNSEETRLAIMRRVADLFELNLVVPVDFPNEKIDLKLRDATWQQVIAACLAGTGQVYLARGNIVWVVEPGSTLGAYFEMRDRLDRATEETDALREVMARLTRAGALPLTEKQRARIQAFLDDPASSASALVSELGPDPANAAAAATAVDRQRDTMSVDFPDELTSVTLRNVADLFELKFIVPPGFPDRKLSIKLRDVTWRRIFEVSLLGSGYVYVARADWVRLVRADAKLGEFGQMRDLTDRDTKEAHELRQVIAFLVRPNAPALTEGQRALLQAFLADSFSSASGLLENLTSEPAKAPAAGK